MATSSGPLGKGDLFNTPGAHLPPYVRKLARAIMKTGKTKSQAISIALSRIKVWAAGGGNVDADTRAKAAKALAEWEEMRAKARATPNKKG